ncbi:MAG TPA: NAD-dependent epimerase/dehydratase family protein [bacterium]|nr:NAD-dependent epimerase/dehydratase family protein [bacterium]
MTATGRHRPRALVTGGAGLIGSHVADRLLRDGWVVRILDNLEPQTHRNGMPAWVARDAEFVRGDIRERAAVAAALQDVDVVFHQAAYGGFMPEIAKYLEVNGAGTAGMLELIRDLNLPIRKVVVASSQAVYPEGAATCGRHGLVFPKGRPFEQLRRGDFAVRCPHCGGPTIPAPTPEDAPLAGETVYAISKVAQERLVLTWARQSGIPAVALRYSCTYGPRQSIFNPYTGVIAIVCTRLLTDQPPVVYEDGLQTRDFCFVEDIADANLLAATGDAWDGLPVNVGSGAATSIKDLCTVLSNALDVRLDPLVRGEFRPGEIRHLTADISRARSAGYAPRTDLAGGVERYLGWIKTQADVRDYFTSAEAVLRAKGIVHRVSVV